jgi:hypothetical protein
MQQAAPLILHHAGHTLFPDVDFPLPIKLIGTAALACIVFGPVLIGFAARRGRRIRRAIGLYVAGVIIAMAYFTWLSGMMDESLATRIGVWAQNIWGPFFGVALVLSLAAAGIGLLIRRLRPVAVKISKTGRTPVP